MQKKNEIYVGNEGFLSIAVLGFFLIALFKAVYAIRKIDKENAKRQEEYQKFYKKFAPLAKKYLEKAFKYRDEFKRSYKKLFYKEYNNVFKCSYAKELLSDRIYLSDLLEDESICFKSNEEFVEKFVDVFVKSVKEMKDKNKYIPVDLYCGTIGTVGYDESKFKDPDYQRKFDKLVEDMDKIQYKENVYVVASPIDDEVEFNGYINIGITENEIKQILIEAEEEKSNTGNENFCSNYIYLLDL